MKKIYTFFIFLSLINAFPQSGNLDITFGNNGKIYTGFGSGNSKANAVAIQPDGKIIVGGSAYTANTVNTWEKDANNFTLARYNADGSMDTTFGFDGKVMTDMYTYYTNNNYSGYIYAVKLQPDGKILAYGGVDAGTVVARYNNNGSIDTGFGDNGIIRCNSVPPVEGNNTLVIQPDGKILVLGMQWSQPVPNTYTTQFVVERYNTNGSYDTSFAIDGRVVTAFGSQHDMPQAIALQPDGKIMVVGTSLSNNYRFAIARYTANGILDTTFDGDGKVITAFGAGTSGIANFVTIHPDGKILVLGTSGSTTTHLTLAKYNSNGSLDTSFDNDGIATNTFSADDTSSSITSVLEQADGKFLVTTSAYQYGSYDQPNDFVTRRYNSDATTDVSFGINGKVATAFQAGFSNIENSVIQPDGKIVVVGYSHALSSDQNEANIVRYQSNGAIDTAFGSTGKVTTVFDSTNDESNILLIQPDDKLIVIGTKRNHTDNGYLFKDIALSRYNSDGSLDSSFGTEGKVVSVFVQNNINKISKAVLQPDNKIIISNTYYNLYGDDDLSHYELIQYTSNGVVDATFGTNGRVIIDAEPNVILCLPDGKIITILLSYDSQNNAALVLKRYHNNGTTDSSFGNNGTASATGTFGGTVSAALQPDGKIVVSYSSPDANEANGLTVKRFNANGSLDSSFESNSTVIDNACYANGVFVQPDGKIIVTGRSVGFFDNYPLFQFVAARYNTNGGLDTTYGINGIATSYLGSIFEPYNIIQSIAYQPDGKFLVALSKPEQNPARPNPDSYDFVIYRFNANGGYDHDFGIGGKITTSFYTKYDEAFSIVLQADDKIVVAGTTDTGINRDFALARYDNTITLGTEDYVLNPNLLLYPNPATSIINLKFSADNDLKISSITIYSVFGQTVFSHNNSSDTIDISNLQSGIYLLKATTNKGNQSIKFIKN